MDFSFPYDDDGPYLSHCVRKPRCHDVSKNSAIPGEPVASGCHCLLCVDPPKVHIEDVS